MNDRPNPPNHPSTLHQETPTIPANLQLHIEELVLHRFARSDRDRISVAMQQELTRLLTEQGIPPTLAQGGQIGQLNGGTFGMANGVQPEVAGIQIAQAIYGGFGQFQTSAKAESKPSVTSAQSRLLQSSWGDRAPSQQSKSSETPLILHEALNLPIRASNHLIIQPKLAIGPIGDKYEQEADRVASQVVST